MRFLSLCLCLFLVGCNIPVLFWEEEARKVVDDVVDEEEKLDQEDHQRATKRIEHLKKDHEYHHGRK